jgi:hypothetical protein
VRNAVDRAIGIAVRDEGSDRDAGSFAIVPAAGDDCRTLVEPDSRSRACLQEPPGLFGDCLEHLVRLRRRRDECRDAAERSLLFGQAIRLAGHLGHLDASFHVITLARR